MHGVFLLGASKFCPNKEVAALCNDPYSMRRFNCMNGKILLRLIIIYCICLRLPEHHILSIKVAAAITIVLLSAELLIVGCELKNFWVTSAFACVCVHFVADHSWKLPWVWPSAGCQDVWAVGTQALESQVRSRGRLWESQSNELCTWCSFHMINLYTLIYIIIISFFRDLSKRSKWHHQHFPFHSCPQTYVCEVGL